MLFSRRTPRRSRAGRTRRRSSHEEGRRSRQPLRLARHRGARSARVRRLAGTGHRRERSWGEVAAATPIRGYPRATVIGLGAIGRAVVAALVALGYEVRVVTRRARPDALDLGARPVDLEDGLSAG